MNYELPIEHKTPTTAAPWFKNCTPQNIRAADKTAYYDSMEYYDVVRHYIINMSNCPYYKSATHNGYLPKGAFAILPYYGRYGEGWIIATPHSHDKVNFDYHIRKAAK